MHYMYKFVHTIVDNMRSICVLYFSCSHRYAYAQLS